MNPLKSGIQVGHWLLRVAWVIFIIFMYYENLQKFNLKNLDFLIAALMVIFSILLLVGGFLKKTTLTVIAAFVLMLMFIYLTVADFSSVFAYSFRLNLLLFAIGFYFLTKGNKG